MVRPYSSDLRERVVASVAGGRSVRQTAELFGVSASSVVKWSQRHRRTGTVRPDKMGGYVKPKLLAEGEWLAARIAAEPDLTLRALLAELRGRGVEVGYGALWRHFAREGISFKKNRARRRTGSAVDRQAKSAMEEVSGPA